MADYLPPEVTAAAMLGIVDLDPLMRPCPKCGNQLRSEVRTEWRTLEQASEIMGYTITAEDITSLGGSLDAFGRVKAAVPYVTCMHCGFDADGSLGGFVEPESPVHGSDADI